MNRLVAALAITIVILGVATGFLFYQNSELQNQLDEQSHYSELENEILELENRIDELENPVYDIEITSFSVEEKSEYLGGTWIVFSANITIKNNGNTDVTGLIVFLERLGDVNHLVGSGYKLLETLHAGEERVVWAEINSGVGEAWRYQPIVHVATLRLGTLVIDEYTLPETINEN
jgi:predicted PurR-regulated permease PerM